MTARRAVCGMVVLLITTQVRADVDSGPKPAEAVPPLKVYAVTGDPRDQELDYAALRKDRATVYVFIAAQEFDRPMFRFLKKLEADLGDAGTVVAVWLTEDPEKSKAYLPQISRYFQGTVLTVLKVNSGQPGPPDWAINSDARLTAVTAHHGKVLKSSGYRSLNETNVPEVLESLQRAVKK